MTTDDMEFRLTIEQSDPDEDERTEVVLSNGYGDLILVQLEAVGEGGKVMALLEAQSRLTKLAAKAYALTQPEGPPRHEIEVAAHDANGNRLFTVPSTTLRWPTGVTAVFGGSDGREFRGGDGGFMWIGEDPDAFYAFDSEGALSTFPTASAAEADAESSLAAERARVGLDGEWSEDTAKIEWGYVVPIGRAVRDESGGYRFARQTKSPFERLHQVLEGTSAELRGVRSALDAVRGKIVESSCCWEDCDHQALYCEGHAIELADFRFGVPRSPAELEARLAVYKHALERIASDEPIHGPSHRARPPGCGLAETVFEGVREYASAMADPSSAQHQAARAKLKLADPLKLSDDWSDAPPDRGETWAVQRVGAAGTVERVVATDTGVIGYEVDGKPELGVPTGPALYVAAQHRLVTLGVA